MRIIDPLKIDPKLFPVTMLSNDLRGLMGSTNGNWVLGGAMDIITDAFLDHANYPVAGNIIYIRNDGVMTLTGGISLTKDGSSSAYITVEGYNTARGDDPAGTNRPLIAMGVNGSDFDDYWYLKNLRFTCTGFGPGIHDYGVYKNCYINNSNAGGNRPAFNLGRGRVAIIDCEGESNIGRAVEVNDWNAHIVGGYFH
ncbi:unnamed protein product, partial [marine sediment metagenome]